MLTSYHEIISWKRGAELAKKAVDGVYSKIIMKE